MQKNITMFSFRMKFCWIIFSGEINIIISLHKFRMYSIFSLDISMEVDLIENKADLGR